MIKFKNETVEKGYESLHPLVREIVKAANDWSLRYDKTDLTLTESLSTPELDKKLNRVSPSHSQGRAVDIRVSDMSKVKMVALYNYLVGAFTQYGYIPLSGQSRRICKEHDNGNGHHIHLAIGVDIIEKYKNKYAGWTYPVHNKKVITKNKEK